ncbi:hypothetical protein [Dysgonomonas sp. 511]|uniref:hypothetical protein n=1 Tax=Dysgonomonas sp. 511 TaxID=2302930 RepID=UPI0013D3B978|nr:hypothetical protein [Dysgonomonas sp. 511]NDV78914.1 hypothetical protein [Dysgonomonas sp. 511]
MSKQTKGTFAALDLEHEIFDTLAIDKNPPGWWLKILDDNELYVEVRKDNYINVYFYGGCLLKITYNKITKRLQAETHRKYMGGDTTLIKKGEYRVCSEKLENPGYLQILKENIRKIYLKDNDEGDKKRIKDKLTVSSEKKVQGELILDNRNLYVDSEFAYALPRQNTEGKNKVIRFDLVSLDNGMLKFVELKLISDPRLRGENIDILKQMEKYSTYIKDNKDEFVTYYTKVAEIKHRIGVWKNKPIIKDIDQSPILLLVNNYRSPLPKGRRTERIEDIECILKKENIDYQILDYSKCK